MELWIWFVMAVALTGLVALIVWLLKWRDPDWTEEDQNKAFSWSKKGSGER